MDKTTAKNAATASKTITLTKREQEIYTILLEGASPKDISFSLKIKPETVYFHQKNIFFKLNVENINEFLLKNLQEPSVKILFMRKMELLPFLQNRWKIILI